MNAPARIKRMMATFFTWSNCHVLKRTQKHHAATWYDHSPLPIPHNSAIILSIANLSRGPYHPKHPEPCMELKRRVGGYLSILGNYDKYALSRFLRLYKLYTEFSRSWGRWRDYGLGFRAEGCFCFGHGCWDVCCSIPAARRFSSAS